MKNMVMALGAMAMMMCAGDMALATSKEDVFPDGSAMGKWFTEPAKVDVGKLGKRYVVTDYGVRSDDSTVVQTAEIQAVIDMAARDGGGVVVLERGTYLSGSLFFRQGTHLHIEAGATLKGVDDIAHYPIRETRIEGQTIRYFCALVNADSVSGFSITGKGAIDGNGHRFWREFWIRRDVNSQCTNIEALRPRLVYISNSEDVSINDVSLRNSAFWTTHIYRCRRVRIAGTNTFSPTEPVKAPSTDAIDIDNCEDVVVRDCYMSVNDDAIALKGGKGTWADQNPENGPNKNILIENCRFGFVHSCLTLGSEAVWNRNIVMRNCRVDKAKRVLWLKMRPDTPQKYEFVRVEGISGRSESFVVVRPWTQFFAPSERADMPQSYCSDIVIKDVRMRCEKFYNVGASDKYELRRFTFEDIDVVSSDTCFDTSIIEGVREEGVRIEPSGEEASEAVKRAGEAE